MLFKKHQPCRLSTSMGIARLLLVTGTGCNMTKNEYFQMQGKDPNPNLLTKI